MKNKFLRITSVILTIVVLGLVISLSCITCFADTPQGVVNLFDETKILTDARISVNSNKIVADSNNVYVSNVIPIGNNDYIYFTGSGLDESLSKFDGFGFAIAVTSSLSVDANLSVGTSLSITESFGYISNVISPKIESISTDVYRLDVSEHHNEVVIFEFWTGTDKTLVPPSSVIINYTGIFTPPIDIFDMYREQVNHLPIIFNNLGYYHSSSLTIIGIILCVFVGFGVVVSIINLIRKCLRGE